MISEVYLISSLPALSFGNDPPLTMEEFDTMLKSELSKKKNTTLSEVSIKISDCHTNSHISRKIYAVLTLIQDEKSLIIKNKGDAQNIKTDLLPKEVLTENPLRRETLIMKCLWDKIDDIIAQNTFTLDEVVAYKLKLQILHRLKSFNKEKGSTVLTSILETSDKFMN